MAETAERGVAVLERAPAKLNLGLRVVGRRPDGFHELDSLFAHLDLADELTLRLRPTPAGSTVGDRLERLGAGDAWLDPRPLSLEGDNLVRRAIGAYRERALPVEVPGLHTVLTKRIPWGAGLGGGSADAAAALRASARLVPSAARLEALAEVLGSDVPFCLAGHPVARVGGRGERIVPFDLPRLSVVLVHPPVQVSAADAFGWWAARPVDTAPMDEGLAAWRSGVRWPLANALEAGVTARVAPVAEALAGLRGLGLGPAAMSGSGSTCYLIVADEEIAATTAAALRARWPGWWVRAAVVAPASTPPVHEATGV
jgi:4-diphosphocytidyl-2-C-methyl-D-erythritol kinase